MEKEIINKAEAWTKDPFDKDTRSEALRLIKGDPTELKEAFYKNLEFGTGGLRGIMGVGTNRMNVYTVGMATQGLADYMKKCFDGPMSVVIAHDSRINSPLFARTTAEVFAANGIHAYLFSELRPTPELSFAVRHLKCQSGVMITASHNPKEYNGYKAYWEDGGQLVPPHDSMVIQEVRKVNGPADVKWNADPSLITMLGDDIDRAYLDGIKSLSLSPEAIASVPDINIVYTSLHGTGMTMVPRCLKELGFSNVQLVEQQAVPDGNFPTVVSPNPEEAAALDMALKQAQSSGADLVMGTDPDADRVGIAVRNSEGELELLNGNMTGSLLLNYLVTRWHELGRLNGKQFTVKTIVTSALLEKISASHQIPCFNVLTGFKYIAELILKQEGKLQFIGGGEESYGYLTGDLVRDKDAVISCVMIAEMCAWAAQKGKSLYDLLIDIYLQHGLFLEDLVSIKKEGLSGSEEIAAMMEQMRNHPPTLLGGSEVAIFKDFKLQKVRNMSNGEMTGTGLPVSNVLQFITADGAVVTARPSGTEPKIKFYFSVNTKLKDRSDYATVKAQMKEKIAAIQSDLNL